ncbi:hypothetical protein ANCCAN_04242 [Ancylostoma caninum]|uniref:Uncharacterized protein n=1 Tax=Ancylostoma caninum TaxID=29170 RepID=A0A368H1H2_ANCCA|nr:hypothetical protein ANCCAN_04242 [Ancylostoma caninum]
MILALLGAITLYKLLAPSSSGVTVTNSESSKSVPSSYPAEVSPSFTLNPGDVKMIHHLRAGGKLVVQKKKNGVSSNKSQEDRNGERCKSDTGTTNIGQFSHCEVISSTRISRTIAPL